MIIRSVPSYVIVTASTITGPPVKFNCTGTVKQKSRLLYENNKIKPIKQREL